MTSPKYVDDDHFSLLFDIASASIHTGLPEAQLNALSEPDRTTVAQLRALLGAIDRSWQASASEREQVRTLFLKHLATQHPNHPWVQTSTIHTLGELVLADPSQLPALPVQTLGMLEEDTTPVETLLDPAHRSAAVGRAVQRAGLPTSLITPFMSWLSRALAQLTWPAEPGSQGLLFTRQQMPTRHKRTTEQE